MTEQDQNPATPALQQVPLFPHLESEEAQKAVAAVLEVRAEADYHCYMLLRHLYDQLEGDLLSILRNYCGMDKNEALDQVEDIEEALKRREASNEEFLNIVSGRGSAIPEG
jgi:hypothetical protein